MATKTKGENSKFLWLGGVIIVALGLLLVGMYGNNLKTQVDFSGSTSETPDCISRADWDEAKAAHSELTDEINEFLRVQIANVTYSIASKRAQISIMEARQRNGENVDFELRGLRSSLAVKEQELIELQAQLVTKMVELNRLADLISRPICEDTVTPSATPDSGGSSSASPITTSLAPPSILGR